MWNAKPAIPESLFTSPESISEEILIEVGAAGHQRGEVDSSTGGGDFVPQEKVSMRKVKEVLRLRFGLGLQQNQIARSCSIGQATVHRYLEKAAIAGLSWPLPEDLDDQRLEELLFRSVGRPRQITRSVPDFAEVRRQLQAHKHLTLQLVWEEYRETQPDAYGYSPPVPNVECEKSSRSSAGA